MRLAYGCFLILVLSATGFTATYYVPDDYSTIQEALNCSVNGDIIVVRPGTYVENIDFMGKAVLLTSEVGATTTVIDGNRAGSVVSFRNGESTNSVLDGFTITNGYNGHGGGINCSHTSPSITNNIITKNEVGAGGGGIRCLNASPIIVNNIISENISTIGDYMSGGGINCYSSVYPWPTAPLISNNIIY